MHIVQGLLGLLVFIGVCRLFSTSGAHVRWTIVVKGFVVQVVVALLVLKLPATQNIFVALNSVIDTLVEATEAGTTFVFGYLGGGPLPYQETIQDGSFVLAFRVLPLILVVSVLSSLFLYWRILPLVINAITKLLQRLLGIGGAVGLAISANAFLGMVESPLLIKPYLNKLSRGELFAVMTAGMATIAGTMLALEASVIADVLPNAVGHLISASLITLPAVVYISHLLEPHRGEHVTGGDANIQSVGSSVVDVISKSTQAGLQILLSVVATLIVVVALVHLVNAMLGLLPHLDGNAITVQGILGYVMAPLAWLIGIPWSEAVAAGQLMGIKTVLTEFFAYIELGSMPEGTLSDRSTLIMAYALCGFANFISVGIMVTGLSVMAPERRQEILALGLKSLIAGTLATSTTACVVGLLA